MATRSVTIVLRLLAGEGQDTKDEEEKMRDHWGNHIGEARDDVLAKPASDLSRRELRDLIGEGVFRGAFKAIGVYLLVTALVAFLWAVLRTNL